MSKWEESWKINCSVCGKELEILMGRARLKLKNGKRTFFCSKDCSNKGRNISILIKENRKNDHFAYSKMNCEICGVKFIYSSQKNRRYCSRKCFYESQHRKALDGTLNLLSPENRKKASRNLYKMAGGGTYIEEVMKSALDKMNIKYEPDYKIPIIVEEGNNKNYWLDIAIPHLKIDIECDGEYWHTGEKFQMKDRKRDEKLKSLGWIILRFPGKKINKEIENCLEEILNLINIKSMSVS